jgi:hypothetical protein
MSKLKSMVNVPLPIVPDNIFFKEWQSQTRNRALLGTNAMTGFVACRVFLTNLLFFRRFQGERHHIFFSGKPGWILAMTNLIHK